MLLEARAHLWEPWSGGHLGRTFRLLQTHLGPELVTFGREGSRDALPSSYPPGGPSFEATNVPCSAPVPGLIGL
jgi:hypothetical protein